jgi:uncharacterized protein YoxC
MDPLSIATGCVGLIGTITKLSVSISAFVKDVRGARGDMDSVSRELQSLKSSLELLEMDSQPEGADSSNPPSVPETLQKQITGIMSNCTGVLEQMQQVLEKYQGKRVDKAAIWALSGKTNVGHLRISLEAHKSALEIALDMLALSIVKDIKEDTTEIKGDTQVIIGTTNDIKEDTALLLQEIARLRTQVAQGAVSQARDGGKSSNFMLERYLDDLTSYAETVVGDDISDGRRSRSSLDAVAEEHREDDERPSWTLLGAAPQPDIKEDKPTSAKSLSQYSGATQTAWNTPTPDDQIEEDREIRTGIDKPLKPIHSVALDRNDYTQQNDESSRIQSGDGVRPQASVQADESKNVTLEEEEITAEMVCAETLYGIFPGLDREVIAKIVKEKESR